MSADRSRLRPTLTLPLLTLYGLGTVVGAGIYVLIGKMAGRAGVHAPVAFLVAATLAALTALSYAELSARLPRAAGEAVYVEAGLRRRTLAIVVGLSVALIGIVSAATLCAGVAGYLRQLVAVPDWLGIAAVALLMGGVAAWGIAQSALLAALLTLTKIGGLLLIAGGGAEILSALPARAGELLPPLEPGVWSAILGAAFLAFFAFLGFEDMVTVAEEVRDVRRTLPRAILLTMAVTVVLYTLLTLLAVLSVPADELAASEAPLAVIWERTTGLPTWPVIAIGLVAVLNGALIQIIKAARVLYGMSDLGWLPAGLGRVGARTATPLRATALVVGLVLALALSFDVARLAELTVLAALFVFTLVNLALWRLKRREAPPPEAIDLPPWVPAAGALVNALFLGLALFHLAA